MTHKSPAWIAVYGQEASDAIEAAITAAELRARGKVYPPKRPSPPVIPDSSDRPALQTEGSSDPRWWDR